MTSLSAQLQRLAIPQGVPKAGSKTRPSLFFTPHHAAQLDNEHFYEIGLTGWAALTQMNGQFSSVGAMLFDSAALTLERTVQTKEVNQRIDEEVRKVLLLLQPYLLLQPALKVLEWLIHRFYIEQYSTDNLLILALPYHETATFVKILQVVDITDPSSRWNWLLPIQAPGHPLGRKNLLAHCTSDPGLLKLICSTTLAAAKLFGPSGAHRLATLAAFHTAIIIGTVQVSDGITEVQMAHITKSLLRGLKSASVDFSAGAMMAIAQIAQKVQLGPDFVSTIIKVIISKGVAALAEERVTLLVLLYASQHEAPPVAALGLVSDPALVQALEALADRGVDVLPLALPMLDAALEYEANDRDSDLNAAIRLVTALTFSPGQARALADHAVVDCTPMKALCPRFCLLLSELERRQSMALDAAVDRAVAHGADDSNAALKSALRRHEGTVFLRLYHTSAQQRALALEELAASVDTLGQKDSAALGEALIERLRDDSPDVLLVALAFPPIALVRLLGADEALNAILSVLTRCSGAGEELGKVASAAVVALAALPRDARPARMLAHLLPHLMPVTKSETEVALSVLQSPLAKRDKFLRSIAATKNLKEAKDICAAVENALHGKHKLLPPPQAFQELLPECKTAMLALASTLLLSAALPTQLLAAQADALARDLLTVARRFKCLPVKKDMKPKVPETDAQETVTSAPGLPNYAALTALGDFPLPVLLSTLAKILSTVAPPNTKCMFWLLQDTQDAASLELRCLSALIAGTCGQRSALRRSLYGKALAEFLSLRYPLMCHRIELLVQAACATHTEITPQLQVRFLRLASALLVRIKDKPITSPWFAPLLLCAGTSSVQAVRVAAFACATDAAAAKVKGHTLLRRVVAHQEIIRLDSAQMVPVLHRALIVEKKLKASDQAMLSTDRNTLFATTVDAETPIQVAAALLSALAQVPALLDSQVPLGHRVLDSGALTNPAQQQALEAVLALYTEHVAPSLKDQGPGWVLLERCIRHLETVGDGTTVAELAMQALSKETLAAMHPKVHEQLLTLLVHLVADCDRTGVATAANRLVKRMGLSAALAAKHLAAMASATSPLPESARRKSRFVETVPPPELVLSAEWRHGVAMLELMQNKRLSAPAQVLPSLFAVLARCLQFEQQAPVEYPKQLVLSLVLQCCQHAEQGELPGLNVEAVVQCIRGSQNPQTHHHALLVLAQLAAIAPRQFLRLPGRHAINASFEKARRRVTVKLTALTRSTISTPVLHNVMSIFTFMGSSVLRQDDAYSVQVITKIVDTVVPTIVNAPCAMNEKDQPGGASGRGVLRVFVDALPGIPSHRVQPLFQRLLVALGPRQALWPLMALLLEAQVIRASGQAATGLSLAEELPAEESVVAATRLIEYLLVLPSDKLPAKRNKSEKISLDTKELFDVSNHTEKQLRHFKFLVVQQIGALLGVPTLPQRIQNAAMKESQLQAVYSELLERLMTLVQRWLAQVSASTGMPTEKYWRVMLTLGLDTLDKINTLLPADMFLAVIKNLLTHRMPVLRRKAMELLNARLQTQVQFSADGVLELLPQITDIVANILQPDGTAVVGACSETELCQQTALLTVKLLAHRLADERPEPFVAVLPLITTLVCTELPPGNIQAAVVLCLAELCAMLRVRAVAHLPKFLPAIVRLLDEQAQRDSPDLATLSVVTAVDKISESLASFLGSHLAPLLRASTMAAARWADLAAHPRVAPTIARLAAARKRLAAAIAPRVLVPAVTQCYHLLVEQQEFSAMGPLLDVLSRSFSELRGPDLKQLLPLLTDLFLAALEMRGQESPAAQAAEGHVIAALVQLTLKLSEESFRPIFYSLFHWASTIGAPEHRAVTFYRLSAELAQSLKGLFSLFARASVPHAANILSAKETTANTRELREYVLQSLLLAISHGNTNFMNKDRYNALMLPIVNQLGLAVTEEGADVARRLVAPCIAQMAGACKSDAQWKQINYQVLLKTRDSKPEVRIVALTALCQLASKLMTDYLPLLPEAIPFLAELLEDEDEAVERAAQDAMRELQETLNEPLDQYI